MNERLVLSTTVDGARINVYERTDTGEPLFRFSAFKDGMILCDPRWLASRADAFQKAKEALADFCVAALFARTCGGRSRWEAANL